MAVDSQSRKWLLTINNPNEHGFPHERIHEVLQGFKSLLYYCLSDEIGLEKQTLHTHVYVCFSSGVRFSTVKKAFPPASLEHCRGTSQQCRDYVFKEGKYKDSDKEETRVPGTQEEWGSMPVERQGKRNDLVDLYDMIRGGMSDYDILEQMPTMMLNTKDFTNVRQILVNEKVKDEFRHVDTTYIFGVTGSGKTRYVMDKYGYSNVYRVTNYRNPFDSYAGEDVLLLDEFRSSLYLEDMLKYLDGYPVKLPCRFQDRQALFHHVYIVSNIGLLEQYPNYQKKEKDSWSAFLRRIKEVHYYSSTGIQIMSVDNYMKNPLHFKEFEDAGKDVPFTQQRLPLDKKGVIECK